MKRFLWFLASLLLIASLLLLWRKTGDHEIIFTPVPSPVSTVEVLEGKVRVQTGNEEKVLEGGHQLIVSATGAQEQRNNGSPTPTAIPTATPPPESVLAIRLVDALGDPISAGEVMIDGNRHVFQNGRLDIQPLAAGSHIFVVSAEGYSPRTETLVMPRSEEAVFTLEYNCSFEFQVVSSRKQDVPIEGAEVVLWKGRPVQRPLPDTAAIRFKNPPSGGPVAIRVRREAEGVRVVNTQGEGPKWRTDIQGPLPRNVLRTGDLILGLAGCMWQPEYPTRYQSPLRNGSTWRPVSPKLRIWDTLLLQSESECVGSPMDSADVQRDGSAFLCNIGNLSVPQERGSIVAQARTDSTGRCRIDGLEPSAYYVQSRKDAVRSVVDVICPSQAGLQLLSWKPNSTVLVRVMRSGIDTRDLAWVIGANVVLQSMGGTKRSGLFSAVTDRTGLATVGQVYWGKYQVTVTPPAGGFLIAKTMEVVIDSPSQVFDVLLDGSGYRVSGKVLRADTREPVGAVPLALFQTSGKRGKYSGSISGDSGEFSFASVLPGQYEISLSMERGPDGIAYLPAQWGGPDENKETAAIPVSVESRDIDGIECLVLPSVQTHFSGTVTMPSGAPVKGARVVFEGMLHAARDEGELTGEDGRFNLTIVTLPLDQIQTAELVATVIEMEPEQTIEQSRLEMGGEKMVFRSQGLAWPQRTTTRGSCKVDFRTGDRISDIAIAMEDADEAPAVIGSIRTEDGGAVGRIQIFVYQNNAPLLGYMNSDGSYRVDWVRPGPFQLQIFTVEMADEKPVDLYCPEIRDLVMPPDQKTLSVDITLVKASYIAGVVKSSDGSPVSGVDVHARAQQAPGETRFSKTDEKGQFRISGVRLNGIYTVEVRLDESSEPLARIGDIQPPADNVTFAIKN